MRDDGEVLTQQHRTHARTLNLELQALLTLSGRNEVECPASSSNSGTMQHGVEAGALYRQEQGEANRDVHSNSAGEIRDRVPEIQVAKGSVRERETEPKRQQIQTETRTGRQRRLCSGNSGCLRFDGHVYLFVLSCTTFLPC